MDAPKHRGRGVLLALKRGKANGERGNFVSPLLSVCVVPPLFFSPLGCLTKLFFIPRLSMLYAVISIKTLPLAGSPPNTKRKSTSSPFLSSPLSLSSFKRGCARVGRRVDGNGHSEGCNCCTINTFLSRYVFILSPPCSLWMPNLPC